MNVFENKFNELLNNIKVSEDYQFLCSTEEQKELVKQFVSEDNITMVQPDIIEYFPDIKENIYVIPVTEFTPIKVEFNPPTFCFYQRYTYDAFRLLKS